MKTNGRMAHLRREAMGAEDTHPNPDKAVGVGRVSATIQVEEGTSLGTQADDIEATARSKGLTLIKTILDEGVSGKRYWTRSGIQEGLSIIERQEAKYLICASVDRAARKAKVGFQIAERVWEAGGILICNGYEFTPDPHGQFLAGIFFNVAELDYNTTRDKLDTGRVKTALGHDPSAPWLQAMQRGTPPYGIYIPTKADVTPSKYAPAVFPARLLGRHVIIRGDKEQEGQLAIVRTLYTLHYEGAKLADLSRWLKGQGIKSPRGCDKWSDSSLDYLLRNEVYRGAGCIFKSTGVFDEKREIDLGFNADYRIPTDRDDWVELLPVVIYDRETGEITEAPPVVDPDIWEAVFKKRDAEEKESAGHGTLHYYLSRFGHCSVCGGRWSGAHVRNEYGDYYYYRCSGCYINGSNGERTSGCSAALFPYMRQATVEGALIDVLSSLAKDPTQIEQAIVAYEDKLYANDALALQRDRLLHEQNVTRRKLDAARDSLFEAEDDEAKESCKRLVEKYAAVLKEIKPSLEALQRQTMPRDITSPKTRSEKLSAAIADVRDALTAGPDFGVKPEEKARALGMIVERLNIDEQGRLVVTFKNLSHIPDLGIQITGPCVREPDNRRKYSREEITAILSEAANQPDKRNWCKRRGIAPNSYYRWIRERKAAAAEGVEFRPEGDVAPAREPEPVEQLPVLPKNDADVIRHFTQAEILAILAEAEAAGKGSKRLWCREKGIGAGSYWRWVKERKAAEAAGTEFRPDGDFAPDYNMARQHASSEATEGDEDSVPTFRACAESTWVMPKLKAAYRHSRATSASR